MGRFTLLPAELQIDIFDRLGTVDIKAARAVSRTFRDNATPALFRSIVACARYQALGAYQNVSLHTVYSNYVREIVFDGTLYNEALARSDNIYYSAEKEANGFNSLPSWSERLRWKRYGTLYKEQEDMKSDGVLLQSLARGLENMQNISSIVYSPHQHKIPAEKKALRDVVPRGYPPSWISCIDVTASDHPFRQLIGAIFLSQYTGIRQLVINGPHDDKWINEFSLSMFTFPGSDDMLAAKHLFRHLVRLELNICISNTSHMRHFPQYNHSPEQNPRAQFENLSKLLETAQDLRYLSFVIPHWTHTSQGMYRDVVPHGRSIFGYLGLGAMWPRLHSLSLQGIDADEGDVIDLITRHRDTLRTLKFTDLRLFSGIWAEVVDEVILNVPMVSTFILDQVYESHAALENFVDGGWGYEGHLVIGTDGNRDFIDSNPAKHSVYEILHQ